MNTANDLKQLLQRIDHKGYPAYKDTAGRYGFGNYILSIDHVQGDPFASPSRLSVLVDGSGAGFPPSFYDKPHKRIALQDHLTRLFGRQLSKFSFKAEGSGKSGLISASRCGQEVLERTACCIDPGNGNIRLRFEAGFPAHGRTIASQGLIRILFDFLPECVHAVCFYANLDQKKAAAVIRLSEDQHYIREQLSKLGLAAFVANGSVLPRESGVSDRPMKDGIPFASPASMEIELELPNRGRVKGMGVEKGITLIVGGGYHGKSTLLKALELGVYDHIAGDGREYVITDDSALKIRAEDGRSIKSSDISMFISNLPNGKDTRAFYTEDASGSTSQAANVIEGIEAMSSLFLIDEDTCATNFMIRDELMQRVVHRDKEPITPFIGRARLLFEKFGISSVIVAGSSGAYFHIADRIVQMDRYEPFDITEEARKEAAAFPLASSQCPPAAEPRFDRAPGFNREVRSESRLKIKTLGRDAVQINHETVELRCLEQLADAEQTAALGYMLAYAEKNLFDGRKDLRTVVGMLMKLAKEKGLAALAPGSYLPAGLAMPRPQEIFCCFNRYRKLKL